MKNKLPFTILSLAVMVVIMNGCGQSKPGPAAGLAETGSVLVSINWPAGKGAKASSIPTSASSIIITASADDMTPVSAEVTYPQTIGTLEVKVGANRTISATAKTNSGAIVASGEVAGVTVSLGTNTPVNIVLAPAAGRNFFPNTDGYSWRWEFPEWGFSYIITVEGTTQIGSITAQVGHLTGVFGGYTATMETYWKIDDTGAYYYGMGTTPEAFTILNFPLEVGKTWECHSSYGLYYPTTVEVLAFEEVTVPAGTFDCYKVSYTAAGGVSYYWFGNGVGAVKALMAGSTEEVILTWKNF